MTDRTNRKSDRPAGAPQRQWRRPVPREEVTIHPPAIAGLLAGLTAASLSALLSLLAIFGAWLLAAHGEETTTQVVRAAGVAWLSAHVVPVTIGTTTLSVLPWGLLVIPSVLLWRSSHRAMQSATLRTPRDYWLVAVSIAFAYALVGIAISLLSSTNDLGTSWWHSALNLGVVALIVSTACVITYAPSADVVWGRMPKAFVDGIKPGLVAIALLLAVGSIAIVASLGLHFTEVRALTNVMAPSSLDAFFLTLLGIGYLPTAITWATVYILGPGVHLGGSGMVSIQMSEPGSLPAFPLLALLPSESPSWARYIIALPIAVGVAVFFAAPREHWRPIGKSFGAALTKLVRGAELVTLATAIAIASVFMWLVSVISSGAIGVRLLDFVGPDPFSVFMATGFLLTIGGLGALVLPRFLITVLYAWRLSRKPQLASTDSVSVESAPE